MADRFWVGGTGSWAATTTNWSATSGGSGGASLPTAADDVYFDANSGSGTVTVTTATRLCKSLSFRGLSGTSDYTGTFAQSGTGSITISGGLTLSASTTYTYAGALTFNGSGGFNITANGVSLSASSITINNVSLTLSFTDAFVTTGSLVLTGGVLLGSTISVGSFTLTSNSLSRVVSFTSMNFTGAGTLATIGATQTNFVFSVTNLYITGSQSSARTLVTSGSFLFPYAYLAGSGTGSISFTSGAGTLQPCNVTVTNTGGAIISLGTGLYGDIIFQSGTNAVWTNAASQTLTIQGNITLTSTQASPTLTPAITLNGGGGTAQTITSAGKSFVTGVITINDVGNNVTYTFADAFSSNAAVTITATGIVGSLNINANFSLTLATNTLTLTAGTLNINNGANITCGLFSSNNSNSRTINMGSGTWTLTGTGTVWNLATTTGLTFNAQQSRILINNTATPGTGANFSGGGLTYYTVEYARGASTATNTISGNNTFANFIDNTSTAAHAFTWTSGSTNTFYKFNVRGSAGALITFGTVTTAAFLVKVGQGIVNCNYITLLTGNTSASPANTWYRGANGTGTSTGWVASNALSSQSLLGVGGVG